MAEFPSSYVTLQHARPPEGTADNNNNLATAANSNPLVTEAATTLAMAVTLVEAMVAILEATVEATTEDTVVEVMVDNLVTHS